MKISASIYSTKNMDILSAVAELDLFKIDYLHIDSIEKTEVFEDIRKIREISSTPIDLHIITSEPEKFFDFIIEHRIEAVTFQYENLNKKLRWPAAFTGKKGIAITMETSIDVFEEYAEECSFFLFMTTTPGISGGSFNDIVFNKIRDFRKKFPSKNIHVDGGITNDISFILRHMGVYCAVSGSYLMNAPLIANALLRLRTEKADHDIKIRDFMSSSDDFPVVQQDALSLEAVLQAIEKSKAGFTVIVNESGQLVGVVTDGDIRRELLANVDDLNRFDIYNSINRNPLIISDQSTIQEMLDMISNSKKHIMFLPVVGGTKELVGWIAFNDLIKGEM
ncbi:CBS domain-containing protein [Paenibacillus sp. KS-LC4]|uniref:CBS domain-containing protein n=1 Tax=Paenibacillus sp. KS-LC4 TaxID=2979727 RepID=UPI0030D3C4B0